MRVEVGVYTRIAGRTDTKGGAERAPETEVALRRRERPRLHALSGRSTEGEENPCERYYNTPSGCVIYK